MHKRPYGPLMHLATRGATLFLGTGPFGPRTGAVPSGRAEKAEPSLSRPEGEYRQLTELAPPALKLPGRPSRSMHLAPFGGQMHRLPVIDRPPMGANLSLAAMPRTAARLRFGAHQLDASRARPPLVGGASRAEKNYHTLE